MSGSKACYLSGTRAARWRIAMSLAGAEPGRYASENRTVAVASLAGYRHAPLFFYWQLVPVHFPGGGGGGGGAVQVP